MHDSVPMRSPMVNANGYVPNDIVPIGIVRSGYLPQDEAFAVRTSLVPSPAGTPDETRAKVSVDGISGKLINCIIKITIPYSKTPFYHKQDT